MQFHDCYRSCSSINSRNLILSYYVDWVMILAATAIALALSIVNPDYHPFCLLDTNISYPIRDPKVSLGLFTFIAIIVPAATVAIVCLYIPLGSQSPTAAHKDSHAQSRQLKLWNLNASLLGLGVSLATATIVFTGTKNLTGKPRPNFLQHCQPDLDPAAITAHLAGPYFGQKLSTLAVLVDQGICQQSNRWLLNDGFRSFPSGYATTAFAGLWYLSLFLSAKFSVTPPSPSSSTCNKQPVSRNDQEGEPLLPSPTSERADDDEQHHQHPASHTQSREEPAAPRVIFLVLPYVPLGLAIFLAGTRYFDFKNHGFDVLAGAGVGTATAWFGFRLYHPPLSSHVGAAWGPR